MGNSLGSTTKDTLAIKLSGVMGEVKSLAKRGRNSEQGYAYVTEADTVRRIRKAMYDRDLLLQPQILSVQTQGYLTLLTMRFTFIDAMTGETLVSEWAGAASDTRDKAIWKAITGAQKYFLLKFFLIPTYDDPERDSPQQSQGVVVTPEPLPVTIASVTAKGRTATFALSDGRKVVCFDTRLVAIAEQRCQDRISVLIRCEGEWRGKAKCIGIDDANPPSATLTAPLIGSEADAVF